MLVQSIKMAWESIRTSKMRSFLTMLGIIIGVYALVVLVSIVDGATGSITDSINSLGSSSLSITILDSKGNPLSLSEIRSLTGVGNIDLVSPATQTNLQVKNGYASENITMYGVTPEFEKINDLDIAYGRFIKEPDLDNHTNVVIVNQDVTEDILKVANPANAVGQTLNIAGANYTVVGVLGKSENNMSAFMLTNYVAYLPYSSLIRLSPNVSRNITSFVASAKDGKLSQAQIEMEELMKKRLKNDEDAYTVFNFDDVMSAMDDVMGTMSVVMGGVAAISLLVGGIGIMNIMLVSVTERTKEIGIRKAIGASRKTILMQFLIEALVLSVFGCAIGIGFSWLTLRIIGAIKPSIDFGLSGTVVVLATLFSMGIGLIFGLYPANKAAKMKPIDALRFDG